MRAFRKIGRILFINILVLAGLLVGFEIFLQAGSYFSKTIDWASSTGWYESRKILDDDVIVKGNPKHPEHDSRGMRNPRIPESAFVVTLGDSHTYGTSVARPYPWPRQLESLIGRTVYNFSFGGWGTLDALPILKKQLP